MRTHNKHIVEVHKLLVRSASTSHLQGLKSSANVFIMQTTMREIHVLLLKQEGEQESQANSISEGNFSNVSISLRGRLVLRRTQW